MFSNLIYLSAANEQLQPIPAANKLLLPIPAATKITHEQLPYPVDPMDIDSQFDDTLMSIAQKVDAVPPKSAKKKKPPPRRNFVIGF